MVYSILPVEAKESNACIWCCTPVVSVAIIALLVYLCLCTQKKEYIDAFEILFMFMSLALWNKVKILYYFTKSILTACSLIFFFYVIFWSFYFIFLFTLPQSKGRSSVNVLGFFPPPFFSIFFWLIKYALHCLLKSADSTLQSNFRFVGYFEVLFVFSTNPVKMF